MWLEGVQFPLSSNWKWLSDGEALTDDLSTLFEGEPDTTLYLLDKY